MPENGGYMAAAYGLTAVIYVGYWLRLRARARRDAALPPSTPAP